MKEAGGGIGCSLLMLLTYAGLHRLTIKFGYILAKV